MRQLDLRENKSACRGAMSLSTAGINNMNHFVYYHSPLGLMTLQANQQGLLGAWFETETTRPDELGEKSENCPILTSTIKQLDEYFTGQRTVFDIVLAAQGTVFQQSVWQALCKIPYGETWNYQQLANTIGNPKAVRAVGLANGKNPISIIVPCHRVIGKNGKLTGYAGGLERKASLLELENRLSR
ncbi:Methylated-DNA--protein-cysteine methyltransferase [Vibrio aestuarianus]|nr:Methylated-DNA--protein-cysteine methyltransferase [Vibrio aestuarianus]